MERLETNKSYSLRAMAKHCQVASSTMSEVINSRANLSVASANKIANKLGLKGNQVKYFLTLVQFDSAKDPILRESLLQNLKLFHPKKRMMQDLSVEQFRQIADWQHTALMELTYLENFVFNAKNAAQALNISLPLAELSLERLSRLGLLIKSSSGIYQRSVSDFEVRSSVKNVGMREYYRQILHKISVALEEQAPTERLSGYLNVPIGKSALPEIDEAFDRFISEIKDIAEKHKNYSDVYHLSMHFINLTKNNDLRNQKENI